MQLTIDRSTLAAGLRAVKGAVPSKTSLPILECVRLDATDDQVALTTSVDATVREPGTLADLVSRLHTPTLDLYTVPDPPPTLPEPADQTAAQEQAGYLANWTPPPPSTVHWRVDNEPLIPAWAAANFKREVLAVTPCAASDESWPVLTGVLIQWATENATSVDTGKGDVTVPATIAAAQPPTLPYTVGINATYLATALEACIKANYQNPTVTIAFNQPHTPLVFRPQAAADAPVPFRVVVMPMHITG